MIHILLQRFSGIEGFGFTLVTSPRKQKAAKMPRVRTILTEKQLTILTAVYCLIPKPDSTLKKHLCEVTGLSPKVIRNWFQNKCCRDRKKILQEKVTEETTQLQSGMVRDINFIFSYVNNHFRAYHRMIKHPTHLSLH